MIEFKKISALVIVVVIIAGMGLLWVIYRNYLATSVLLPTGGLVRGGVIDTSTLPPGEYRLHVWGILAEERPGINADGTLGPIVNGTPYEGETQFTIVAPQQ